MISFHPTGNAARPDRLARGWRAVPVVEMARIARCVAAYPWSPCVFRDGRRLESQFISSHWCAYDFDSYEYTLAQALRDFCDRTHVIGTTRSHGKPKGDYPACDRFRVIVPWEAPITDLRTYRWNMRERTRFYDMDKSCVDGARVFFPCVEIVSVVEDGYVEEVDAPPDNFENPEAMARHREARAYRMGLGVVPAAVRRYLDRDVIPHGQRNTTIYRLAKDLTEMGLAEAAILDKVLDCPTYRDLKPMHPKLYREILRVVASGCRSKRRELAERGEQ